MKTDQTKPAESGIHGKSHAKPFQQHEILELKPCPFCGSKHPLTVFSPAGAQAIECGLCLARGPIRQTARGAEAAWNTRKETKP